jgi:hypothetical protein
MQRRAEGLSLGGKKGGQHARARNRAHRTEAQPLLHSVLRDDDEMRWNENENENENEIRWDTTRNKMMTIRWDEKKMMRWQDNEMDDKRMKKWIVQET